jgi:hypothetical protein
MKTKSTLHSHTHCQVEPADTQAKTWQKVCLSNRTADRQTDEEKEALSGNSTYQKVAVQCSAETFVNQNL